MTTPLYQPGSWAAALGASPSTMVTTKGAIDFKVLVDEIEQLTAMAKSKIAQIRSKGSAMSIGDMFDLQMAMNKLQQFSEMSTSVISAMNTSIGSMARNVKG
jgi:hypothetical protein